MKRVPACIVLATLALAACGARASAANVTPTAGSPTLQPTSATSVAPPNHAPVLGVGPATVAVAVATVWRARSSPRAVDAPALANPVRIQTWLTTLTLVQRRALSGRADTQALLGERVRVLAVSGAWARVVVPDQPSPRDRRGYPGWIPVRQLVAGSGPTSGTTLTVVAPTAWLRGSSGARLLNVSYGTQLPGLAQAGVDWQVLLPDGRRAQVAASSVVAASLPGTAQSIVRAARQFLGLDYLWAGNSGFGFDCSGLMEIVYRVHGIQIPRDAAAQAVAGRVVSRSALRPGDLVFFARGGVVHHVGMYVGNGMMLHAPHTGDQVKVSSILAAAYAREYSGARRFLP